MFMNVVEDVTDKSVIKRRHVVGLLEKKNGFLVTVV